VPLKEYLETCYRPDCEYLEGQLLERNVGEWEHGRLQALLSRHLNTKKRRLLKNRSGRKTARYDEEVKDGVLRTQNPDIYVPLAEL